MELLCHIHNGFGQAYDSMRDDLHRPGIGHIHCQNAFLQATVQFTVGLPRMLILFSIMNLEPYSRPSNPCTAQHEREK